jgi:phosphonate transport system permease protein
MIVAAADTSQTRLDGLLNAYATAAGRKRKQFLLGGAIAAFLVLVAGWMAEVDLALFFANTHKFPNYIGRIFYLDTGQFVLANIQEWFWGIDKWTRQLAETLLIAYVATFLGVLGGFFASFFAASNLGVSSPIRLVARRTLEFCRTVPELVFALIFVLAFGLGPMAGVLAIAVHTVGAMGKLFYEVLENIDPKPVEGLTASGASWTKTMRFAVVPQVLANFASYALLRFEINVRGASIMGFVGAGGIGQDLIEAIHKFYYSDVSAILILIIITVGLIDLFTERVRHRFIAEVH